MLNDDELNNVFLLPVNGIVNPKPIDKPGRVRDASAARLKALGWNLLEIAKHLGLGDENDPERAEQRVNAAIKRAMASAVMFARDEARQLELIALDELEIRLWKLLDAHPAMIQHGKIVLDHGTGEPLEDHRFALEVMDRIMKVRDQRAKVTGVYAPLTSINASVPLEMVSEEIKRLELQLGINSEAS